MTEERHSEDGDFDVLRRQCGKYYSYILDLREALQDVIVAVEGGDVRKDEDVGIVYTQIFGKDFLDRLKELLKEEL